MSHCQQGFEQAGQATRRFRVADVGFDGTHGQHPVALAEYLPNGFHLGGVADRRARTVRFKITDVVGRQAGLCQSQADGTGLRGRVWSREAAAAAVVGKCRGRYQPQDRVTVPLGIGQTLENHNCGPLRTPVAIGALVEGFAAGIGRKGAQTAEGNLGGGIQQQVHSPSQSKVGGTGAQIGAGIVQRYQRRGTGRVQAHRRAFQAIGKCQAT